MVPKLDKTPVDIKNKDIDELIQVRGIGKDTITILEKMKELLKENDQA